MAIALTLIDLETRLIPKSSEQFLGLVEGHLKGLLAIPQVSLLLSDTSLDEALQVGAFLQESMDRMRPRN